VLSVLLVLLVLTVLSVQFPAAVRTRRAANAQEHGTHVGGVLFEQAQNAVWKGVRQRRAHKAQKAR